MKKLILLTAILGLVFISQSSARMSLAIIGSGVPAVGGCTEEIDFGTGAAKSEPASNGAGQQYVAHQFTAGNWSDITKVQLYLDESGNTAGQTWTIRFYNNSSNDPTTTIDSCTFSGTDFTSNGYFGCTLGPMSLTNTTSYHVGINRAGATDGSNFFYWLRDETTGTDHYNKSSDESSWTAQDFTSIGRMKFYSGAGCSGD